MRTKRLALSAFGLAAILLGSLCVGPAQAVDSDGGDYIGMAPPERDVASAPTASEKAQSTLFDLYSAKLAAVEKSSPTSALDAKIKTAQAEVVRLTGFNIETIAPEPEVISQIASAKSSGNLRSVQAANRSAVVKLGVNHVGQQKNNWCGPATGYMILKYKGKTSKSGRSLSQTALSEKAYMGTGSGSTNWGEKDMTRGLNAWGSLGYSQYDSPSTSRLQSIVLSKIDAGRPLAYGTAEYAGGKHYNNHPASKNVYHWITGYGYENSGSRVVYLDPATTVWSDVKKANNMATSTMSSYISAYGVAG